MKVAKLIGWLKSDTGQKVVVYTSIGLLLMGQIIGSFKGCSSQPEDNLSVEMAETINSQVEDALQKDREERTRLQVELDALRWEIETLNERMEASTIEREEVRDAIESAGSIDAIDKILKSGIRGASGRRNK